MEDYEGRKETLQSYLGFFRVSRVRVHSGVMMLRFYTTTTRRVYPVQNTGLLGDGGDKYFFIM